MEQAEQPRIDLAFRIYMELVMDQANDTTPYLARTETLERLATYALEAADVFVTACEKRT